MKEPRVIYISQKHHYRIWLTPQMLLCLWRHLRLVKAGGSLVAGWGSDRLFGSNRGPMNILFAIGTIFLSVSALWLMPLTNLCVSSCESILCCFFVFGPQMLIERLAAARCSHKDSPGQQQALLACLLLTWCSTFCDLSISARSRNLRLEWVLHYHLYLCCGHRVAATAAPQEAQSPQKSAEARSGFKGVSSSIR